MSDLVLLPASGPIYRVLEGDPAWEHHAWNPKTSSRDVGRQYPTMTDAQICALPVAEVAAENAVLFLWATMPTLPQALRTMEAWGFTYKTVAFVWIKTRKITEKREKDIAKFLAAIDDAKKLDLEAFIETFLALGMGFFTRANAELCLLGTRGKTLRRKSRSVRQIIIAPRREHSRKPHKETKKRMAQLYDGPYLELFARQRWPGWDSWGNDVDKFAAAVAPEPEGVSDGGSEGELVAVPA